MKRKRILIIAGPNGAGKTTFCGKLAQALAYGSQVVQVKAHITGVHSGIQPLFCYC